jgi:hypothetical protein
MRGQAPLKMSIDYIYIYEYVWKLNQTVLELDFRPVKFLFFPRRDLNPHEGLRCKIGPTFYQKIMLGIE